LEEISRRPELAAQFRFHLYFKSKIPDYSWLDNPIFHKKIVWQPLPRHSFVLYYYVFLPLRLWFLKLDAMFYPNYMLPIIHPPWMPSLVLLTDDIWYEMRSSEQRPHHRLAYWVFGYWAVWCATKFLAISESSKRELVRLFRITPERIEVAHLGINQAHDERSPHTTARAFGARLARPACRQAGNEDAAPVGAASRTESWYGAKLSDYILYVAQAFPRRHLRETIQAFEKIAPQFPDLKLIAIGPDKYHPPLTIRNEPASPTGRRVIRKDYVSDDELAILYAHAGAFVYVSNREAFGMPPLEALAYGIPSVLADKPISRELFGDSAFFVEHLDSSDEIARALTDALTNTEKRVAIYSAAPVILSRFTWPRFTSRWLDIIKNCTVHIEGQCR
jgi:glycosyltransferase involved in cell wall biosynthesis